MIDPSVLFSLNNKVAIITGAARGNGKAIAESYIKAGAVVYFIDILKEELIKTVNSIQSSDAEYIVADLTDKNDLKKLVTHVYREQHRVNILVNNAGISISGPSESYTEKDWEKTYKINLRAAFTLSQMVAKYMIRQREGVIINITSLGAEQGFSNNPAYVAFKGGLKQLTKALAKDWAKYNIRVNNLCPGYFKTDMTIKSWRNPLLREQRTNRTMLKRWGESSDLIGPAIFLASDASKYITGQDLYVDGGWLVNGV